MKYPRIAFVAAVVAVAVGARVLSVDYSDELGGDGMQLFDFAFNSLTTWILLYVPVLVIGKVAELLGITRPREPDIEDD